MVNRLGLPTYASNYPVVSEARAVESFPRQVQPIVQPPLVRTNMTTPTGKHPQQPPSANPGGFSNAELLDSGAAMGRRGLLIDVWA